MCPGLRPEMDGLPSSGDHQGPAQAFTRAFSNNFTQFMNEMVATQTMNQDALAASLSSSIETLYLQSAYIHKWIFQETFKRMFVSVALYLTYALAGLDVLSPHLSYPTIAKAAGGWSLLTGYFSLTISSAKLFFNLSLYSAVCCICLLLSLKISSLLFNSRQQQAQLSKQAQLEDANQLPNATYLQNQAMIDQIAEVMALPSIALLGYLTEPLKIVSCLSAAFATLATFSSFIFPTMWQLFFWGITISVVYVVSTSAVASTYELPAAPPRDLEA